jgi:hypothetical protein
MDKCPTCERKFEAYEDFPLIYIHDFKRIEIPIEAKLWFNDREIYAESNDEISNPAPPPEVMAYFKKHPKKETYDHEGWIWRLDNTSHDRYMEFRRHNKDAKKMILEQLNPWFDSLEKLVGTEVIPDNILPIFAEKELNGTEIPETQYILDYSDYSKEDLEDPKMVFKLDRTLLKNENQRLLRFYVAFWGGGSLRACHVMQNVAYLIYEGKLRKT